MCWLFALARPATKSRGRAIAGPRNILLALAIVSAIAIGSENAAVEKATRRLLYEKKKRCELLMYKKKKQKSKMLLQKKHCKLLC